MELNRKGTPVALMTALRADHACLEASFRRVLAALRVGEADITRATWQQMEEELEEHMKAEEEYILPAFERAFPHEAARVRSDHADIRRQLVQLGVELDLHALQSTTAEAFTTALREHAKREEGSFYDWASKELPQRERGLVLSRLRAIKRRTDMPSAPQVADG